MKRKRVSCSIGFLLLMAGLIYLDGMNLFVQVFAACALHEAGHCLAASLAGSKIYALRLTAIGAEMKLASEIHLSYAQDALIAFAGPAVNLLAAWAAVRAEAHLFAGLNLCLGFFNLFPIRPLDGARIVTGLLSYFDPVIAEKLISFCSILFSGALLGVGWAAWKGWGNPSLFCIAAWLTAGAINVKK